ncbi:peptide chain release factor N(5)-glutamine methyltransferase [Buchnera aphidicola (Thelaxes californica)]|uniref:peptide chain release factor N(5)-glutamine methyltransferase n=1 Tax=Buchnera aphidicola (Thelaxes californica) TaxID=1315998 RepID=A0A4D6YBC4_9GAMM|nr:peptide chain release factor N(5)-glutamine methyltransferase [Buchnera aphidicola]QCI26689.1 peptide chain release factor N(5)-glutamine methyltransferase [Buchnera aphidicola (Thelaxes californica)]
MMIKEWYIKNVQKLNCYPNIKKDIFVLLSTILNKPISWIRVFDETKLTLMQKKNLDKLLYQRMKSKPLSYIIQNQEFWSLNFKVTQDTLIPRVDTERLVEIALLKINNNNRKKYILDLGTGCGAIALSIAKECPQHYVVGIDNCRKALKIAYYNANKLKINNVLFLHSNWFSTLKNFRFHYILSNPPYIGETERYSLDKELTYEPNNALFSKKNGLSDIQHIIEKSSNYLLDSGWLILEHGWKQKIQVMNLFYKNNYKQIKSYKDYNDCDRVIIGSYNFL